MHIVRETFTAKPGMASKLAKLFKETFSMDPRMKFKVMTDAVGPYNTVVVEFEAASLADFEKTMMESGPNDEKIREKMKGYTDMYLTGRREIYRVV